MSEWKSNIITILNTCTQIRPWLRINLKSICFLSNRPDWFSIASLPISSAPFSQVTVVYTLVNDYACSWVGKIKTFIVTSTLSGVHRRFWLGQFPRVCVTRFVFLTKTINRHTHQKLEICICSWNCQLLRNNCSKSLDNYYTVQRYKFV